MQDIHNCKPRLSNICKERICIISPYTAIEHIQRGVRDIPLPQALYPNIYANRTRGLRHVEPKLREPRHLSDHA